MKHVIATDAGQHDALYELAANGRTRTKHALHRESTQQAQQVCVAVKLAVKLVVHLAVQLVVKLVVQLVVKSGAIFCFGGTRSTTNPRSRHSRCVCVCVSLNPKP